MKKVLENQTLASIGELPESYYAYRVLSEGQSYGSVGRFIHGHVPIDSSFAKKRFTVRAPTEDEVRRDEEETKRMEDYW
jgi:hypothetical protein